MPTVDTWASSTASVTAACTADAACDTTEHASCTLSAVVWIVRSTRPVSVR